MHQLLILALVIIAVAATAQDRITPHYAIEVEFVVLTGALDGKPAYINPRAVTFVAPHTDEITRIGFIGGDVKSVEGGIEPTMRKLIEPPTLKR